MLCTGATSCLLCLCVAGAEVGPHIGNLGAQPQGMGRLSPTSVLDDIRRDALSLQVLSSSSSPSLGQGERGWMSLLIGTKTLSPTVLLLSLLRHCTAFQRSPCVSAQFFTILQDGSSSDGRRRDSIVCERTWYNSPWRWMRSWVMSLQGKEFFSQA